MWLWNQLETQNKLIVQQAGPRRSSSFCYICNKLTTLHFCHMLFWCGNEIPDFFFFTVPQKRKSVSEEILARAF